MPCRSYEDDRHPTRNDSVLIALKENNDKLARISCNVLTAIENGTSLEEVLKDTEISTWWKQHKLADAKAQKQKQKEDVANKARQVALSKLTPDEIKALGLLKGEILER